MGSYPLGFDNHFLQLEPITARGKFIRNYNEIKILINAGHKEEAKAELPNLRDIVKNLFEFSWLGVAEFSFNEKWSTKGDQLDSINLAIAYEPRSGYLPEDMFVSALASKFRLRMQLKHFQATLNTYNVLMNQASVTQTTKEQLKMYANRIAEIRSNRVAFSVLGEVAETGDWTYELLWNRFALDVGEGEVSDIRLYCDRTYLGLPFNNDMVYDIDSEDEQGGCGLSVYGQLGATITLHQI